MCALPPPSAASLRSALTRWRFVPAAASAAHLNTNYRHFLLFVTEFQLVDKKELLPLAEFNDAILNEEKK